MKPLIIGASRGIGLNLLEQSLKAGHAVTAFVRHPQYFLAMLVIWATPILTLNWLTFNVAATLYIVIGSRIEERRLELIYGTSYRDYKRRVPWLLPFPRRARI